MSSIIGRKSAPFLIGLVLCVGIVAALFRSYLPSPPYPQFWHDIAITYLLFGGLLGLPRLVWKRRTSVWEASGVTILAMGIILGLDASSTHGTISDLTLLWVGSRALVPFVIALMAPLGIANPGLQRRLVGTVLGSTFVVSSVYLLNTPSTADGDDFPRYVLVFFAIFAIVGGVVAGLPLLVFGLSLRFESTPVIRQYLRTKRGLGR